MLTGTHEIQVQQALVRSVRAGDVVWDVGANIGYLALVAARIVGPAGRVVAIEPDAQCAAAIRRNAQLNDLAGVEVVEAAAAGAHAARPTSSSSATGCGRGWRASATTTSPSSA